ncbi:MAG: tetratricopeptide repeat protein, partial [Bacteroidales bacterium]|nr:tetratricopeptide repeat protein [Bacteroidales bacterium]
MKLPLKIIYVLCKNQLVLILFCIALIMNSAGIPAQTNSLDTIQELSVISSDTGKVKELIRMSQKHMSFSPGESEKYVMIAVQRSKELGDPQLLASAYKAVGNLYYFVHNNHQAVRYYDSSLVFFKQIEDSVGLSKIYNNLGIVYSSLGFFNRAIKYHVLSLEIKVKSGDSIIIANSMNNIGSTWFALNEFNKSLLYFEKALVIAVRKKNEILQQTLLNNIGLVYLEKRDFAKTMHYFRNSLELGINNDLFDAVANLYLNLGKCYFDLGKPDSALYFYFKSSDIFNDLGVKSSILSNNIAQVYIEADQYNKAEEFLGEALIQAHESYDVADIRNVYKNYSVLYERLKQFEKAYDYYLLYNFYDDSISNQIHSRKLMEVEAAFEIASKEKHIELLRKEKLLGDFERKRMDEEIKRQKFVIRTFITGSLVLIILFYIIFILYRQKKKANDKLIEQNATLIESKKLIEEINLALKDKEEKLRKIFDSSPYAMTLEDGSGNILECNPAGIKMFRLKDLNDMVGRNISEFLDESNKLKGIKNFKNLLLNKEINNPSEYLLIRNDGTKFFAEISSAVINDPSRNSIMMVSNIVDVNERVNFVKRLEEAKKDAEESDRLKSA